MLDNYTLTVGDLVFCMSNCLGVSAEIYFCHQNSEITFAECGSFEQI